MALNLQDLLWGKLLDYLVYNKAISVSKEFHTQCAYVKDVTSNDVTGVVNTILDYAIDSASSATYRIECVNQNLETLLNKWLSTVNIELLGKIPTGVSNLATEYFKELWQGSSLCLLRVNDWENIEFKGNHILVPKSLYFVNGSSVYVKRENEKNYSLGSDKYYLDKAKKTKIPSSNKEEIIVQKAFSRWFDEYPIPYIVRKGIYKNFKALQILQDKGDELITKALPYLFLMSMGNSDLYKAGVDYKPKDLEEFQDRFKEQLEKYKKENGKVPTLADTFDKKYEHLIPEYDKVLKEDLFKAGYRALLSGLGFIDVIQGVSSSRQQSVLNPKPFIASVNSGIEGYKSILHDVAQFIIVKNKKHVKLFGENNSLKIVNSPLKINVEAILDIIRSGYDRGSLSIRTYIETLGFDFETEKERREKEYKDGLEDTFYPHLIQNREDIPDRMGSPAQPRKNIDEKNEPQNKKKNTPESKNFKNAEEIEEAVSKYIRIRQIEPDKFEKDSFRTIILSKSKGIKAIIGRLKGQKTTTIQSYLFDKEKWSQKEAEKWVKENKGKVEASLEYIISNIEDDSDKQYNDVKCKSCGHEFDYLSISEAGMGYVKCPSCQKAVTQNDLIIAPYKELKDLPKAVQKMPQQAQKIWLNVWNSMYKQTKDEQKAFAAAWSKAQEWLKKNGYKKDKDGNWIKK